MRLFLLAFSVLLAAAAPLARAADEASLHAILIIATKEKAPADPKLAPYEATLQRNLPESSFRYAAEGRASISGRNKSARISLRDGHSIELAGGERDADGILIKVRWMNGRTLVMNNAFTFQPGVPIVLGSRGREDSDVPIVILIAR